mmetsp:Transcript_70814/g.207505  ORF Transcript_70814/g.207505 Transcript_70814/m.207505 type:complete len:723 (+) Transcript_70814:102-2270(+)
MMATGRVAEEDGARQANVQLGLLEAQEPDADFPELRHAAPASLRWRRLAAVAAVAVALGLAVAVAAGVFADGKELMQEPLGQDSKPLVLMQDLRLLGAQHFTAWNDHKSKHDNVEMAVSHLLSSSGLKDELTDEEVESYTQNFVAAAEMLLKSIGHPTDHQWQDVLKQAAEDEKPEVSRTFVDHVNNQHLGYTLEFKPWMQGITRKDVQNHLGLVAPSGPPPKAPAPKMMSMSGAPKSFHAHDKWAMCSEVIRRDHNQGTCGSCWAFAALSVLDSRLCIKTGGDFKGVRGHLSRTYATSCARKDSSGNHIDGCQGGWGHEVFELVATHGIPTGGSQGCLPYFGQGDGIDHFDKQDVAPACPGECIRAGYPRPLHSDKFRFGTVTQGWYYSQDKDQRTQTSRIQQVQQSLMNDGPVVAYVFVGQEFFAYSSGILNAGCNEPYANHAVSALGFGGNNCPHGYHNCRGFYWSLLNSWGDDWGNGGEMKIAACLAASFDIPGDISSSDISSFPNPLFPTGDSNGGSTPQSHFTVNKGNCKVEDNCVVSPNWPHHYGNNEECTITVSKSGGVKLNVAEFSTEEGYDRLTVNGQEYHGGEGPHLQTATGTIKWKSDYSVAAKGWKLCEMPEGLVHDRVTCESVADDLELRVGEEKTITCPNGCASIGTVWGSNPYTSDSVICKAAANAMKQGAITVKMLGDKTSFPSSSRNGVGTLEWSGSWTAFKIS